VENRPDDWLVPRSWSQTESFVLIASNIKNAESIAAMKLY
jgi:hypothetical protein